MTAAATGFRSVAAPAARALRSSYCTAAHSTFLRDICGDEATMRSIAEHPDGAGLDPADRSVYRFAAKVATDAAAVEQADVDRLKADAVLSDAEVADVVFAVAARSFFTRVLDGLGAQLDAETADQFAPAVRAAMMVGRPAKDASRPAEPMESRR